MTVATFGTPYEAELARAALDSQGIPAIVHNDHGQYLSAGAWVQLQVAPGDSKLAVSLLDQGPLLGPDSTGRPNDADTADDIGAYRASRRFVLARWFLYAGALVFLLSGFLMPLAGIGLLLAEWSKFDARRAFGIACGLQTLVVLVSIATTGLSGLQTLIPWLAFYFAWASAAPAPDPSLVASPYPSTRSIDIGDSWQENGAQDEPQVPPTWFLRDVGWLLFAVVIVAILAVMLRPG